MKHLALRKVFDEAELSKSDSDFAYFHSLLSSAEALAKTIVAGMIASLDDDIDSNRYRLEHLLVGSNGLGDWHRAIEDVVSGIASQFLLADARDEKVELTKRCKSGEWQYEATAELNATLIHLGINDEDLPVKTDLKQWFQLFVTLRNRTKAHGAIKPGVTGKAVEHIALSLNLIVENFSLFQRPWAYLYRNLSGKYRVSTISGNCKELDYFTSLNSQNLENGVYIFYTGSPRLVRLMHSDPDLQDFYLPNGRKKALSYELLSYITGNRESGDASLFQTPPGELPSSETEGYGELLDRGNCYSNTPEKQQDYIDRIELEGELRNLLLDERHPIVTLHGRGGIGKTSLAIKVIHDLFDEERYEPIVWLSARDIELLPDGPKPVKPAVSTIDNMARLYCGLVLPEGDVGKKEFDTRKYFEKQLLDCELGKCLFVLDNFETVQNPVETYKWIDTYIRHPNKVLITTRLRNFKGDYPVEVSGMSELEAKELIHQTAGNLGILDLVTADYHQELITKSGGHPYVIKILLGSVAKTKQIANIPQMLMGTEDILTALFERTYAALSPCAQQALLTLSAWNSAVPVLVLKAVLINSTEEPAEVENGIETLRQHSIAEIFTDLDNNEFISLPLAARIFGKKKLNISAGKAGVLSDVDVLKMLGLTGTGNVRLSLVKKIERMIGGISRELERGSPADKYEPILEAICHAYNPGWLLLAKWHMEASTKEGYKRAKEELEKFLENDPSSDDASKAWQMLGQARERTGDNLGSVHAHIERAQFKDVPFHDLSNTANKLNQVFKSQGQRIEKDQKRALSASLVKVLQSRKGEAEADDFSRMAWVAIHCEQKSYARDYVNTGLELNPENPHLQKLAQRLGITLKA